jgi:hypothetical protein
MDAVTQAAKDLHAAEERVKAELDAARKRFRAALRDAYEAGSSYSELGQATRVQPTRGATDRRVWVPLRYHGRTIQEYQPHKVTARLSQNRLAL